MAKKELLKQYHILRSAMSKASGHAPDSTMAEEEQIQEILLTKPLKEIVTCIVDTLDILGFRIATKNSNSKQIEFWTKVRTILETICGATFGPIERKDIITAFGNLNWDEYRFGGKLGFGGKIYNDGTTLYVSCYPEDESPKRRKIIKKANTELKRLIEEYKPSL